MVISGSTREKEGEYLLSWLTIKTPLWPWSHLDIGGEQDIASHQLHILWGIPVRLAGMPSQGWPCLEWFNHRSFMCSPLGLLTIDHQAKVDFIPFALSGLLPPNPGVGKRGGFTVYMVCWAGGLPGRKKMSGWVQDTDAR